MRRKRKGYGHKIAAARKRGTLGSCTCWDCLRAVGITVPGVMRDKHKRLHPSETCKGPGIDTPGIHLPGYSARRKAGDDPGAIVKALVKNEQGTRLRSSVAGRVKV